MTLKNCPFLKFMLLVYNEKKYIYSYSHTFNRTPRAWMGYANVSGILQLLGKHFVSLSRSASDEATSK